MRIKPKDMPVGTDGQAHLFFSGAAPRKFMAVSTTGCIALRAPDQPDRVLHWYYRSKGKELIAVDPCPWLMLWACRAPWNTEPCGHLTRLNVANCGLTSLDVRSLTHLVHLRCNRNVLERLDCSGMTHLKSLDCSGNELVHLDVEGCRRLEILRVAGNPRLPMNASQLLARARGEPPVIRRRQLIATSLFDL